MALVSEPISGFHGGVSQQSPENRQDTQCESMVNCMGTFVNGLAKRPGTEFVGNLNGGSLINTGSYIHKIERDANERYLVVFTDSAVDPVKIYDVTDGSQKTVSYENTGIKEYMQSDYPKQTMRAYTVTDTTIVVNRFKTVSMTADVTAYNIPDITLYEDDNYNVTLAEPANVKNTYRFENKVVSISKITDLPSKKVLEKLWEEVESGEIVYRVENISEDGVKSPTFYLKCDHGETHFTECVGDDEQYRIDNTTAPHKIVRQSDGTFLIGYIEYDERISGDSVDAPLPSFVGRTIQDLTFHNGRLWFLLSDGIVGSRSLEFYNFFQKTTTEVLDDDPIDIADAGAKAGIIESMAVYDKSMILLGRDRQLVLEAGGNNNLTPKTAVLTPVTTFGVVPHTEPLELGASVFFMEPKDRFLATREFMIQPDTLIEDAADITAHVPRYIPYTKDQDYAKITGSSLIDTLFIHTTGDPNVIYVYKYYWTGNERVQASWHKWEFNKDIVSIMMIGGTHLYVVFKDAGSVHLERMDMDFDYLIPDGETKDIDSACLDRRVMVTGTYDVGTDKTTWTLPYHEWVDQDDIVGIDPLTGFAIEGTLSGDNETFTADGDHDGQDLIVGLKFKSEYELSRWCLKPQQGTPFLEDWLKLREIALSFKETGYFRVEYEVTQRPVVAQQEYTATVIGESTLGKVELRHGVHRFSMYSRPIDTQIKIINDSWLPMKIQTGEYSGYYGGRYKRV